MGLHEIHVIITTSEMRTNLRTGGPTASRPRGEQEGPGLTDLGASPQPARGPQARVPVAVTVSWLVFTKLQARLPRQGSMSTCGQAPAAGIRRPHGPSAAHSKALALHGPSPPTWKGPASLMLSPRALCTGSQGASRGSSGASSGTMTAGPPACPPCLTHPVQRSRCFLLLHCLKPYMLLSSCDPSRSWRKLGQTAPPLPSLAYPLFLNKGDFHLGLTRLMCCELFFPEVRMHT